MSAAERLVALFVAPASATPSPTAAAENDLPALSTEAGSAAPGPMMARSAGAGGAAPGPVTELSSPPLTGLRLRIVPTLDGEDAEPSGASASESGSAERPIPVPTPGGPAAAERVTLDGVAASLDACGLRVCVLGGGGRAGSSFAWALAARLARLPGARCAVVCAPPIASTAATTRPPGLSGPPGSAARRVARGLVAAGHGASVRGRVVELALPDAPESVEGVLAAARGSAPEAPILTLLPGSRRSALDTVLGRQDLVLVVVAADAASSLSALAVAELTRIAPGAVVRTVPLPGRLGTAARRTAVTRALEALR